MNKNFIKKIQNHAFQNDLWKKNSKIIIGISGGPDSVCLLDLLSKLSPKYNFTLHAAHVNYGLREEDSEKDEQFVSRICKKYNVKLTVLKVKKKDLGKNPTEDKMRDIRYDFFEKIRKDLGFDLVSVAHNQDDQAETVLMRIIRGSGLQGLRAIQPKSKNIIRPLLKTSRKEIIQYLKKENLDYCIDKTNLQPIFLRNKLRNELIPHLEKNYNPKIKEVLSSNASIISMDYDALIQISQKKLQNILLDSKNNKSAIFSSKKFNTLHPSIQRHALRILIEKIKENTQGIESKHIEEIIKISKSSKKKRHVTHFGGLKIERKGDRISVTLSKK